MALTNAECLQLIRDICLVMLERLHNCDNFIEKFQIFLDCVSAMKQILELHLPPELHDDFVLCMIAQLIDFDYNDFRAREN